MKLISETYDQPECQLVENELGDKHYYVKGIFLQSEIKNKNGRIYPKPILENAVNEYVLEYVQKNRALGELNHPARPTVDPSEACILIESLQWEGNNVIGRAKVLDTPKGQIVSSLVSAGVGLGISSRGLGSVKKGRYANEEALIVGDDYKIICADLVFNPSGPQCFLDAVYESVDFYYENGILKERQIEEIQEHIRKNDKEAIMRDFRKFVSKI